MKALQFTKVNDLSQLHDELLAAIPALRPVNSAPVMSVEGLGNSITLTVPDNTDAAAVQAVVTAHNPAVPNAFRQQIIDDATSLSDMAAQYQANLDGLQTIRTHMAAIQAGPASPNAAQTGTALKTLAGDLDTVCVGLTRMLKATRVVLRRREGL